MRKITKYQAAVIAVVAETVIGVSLFLIPALTVIEKLKIFGGLFIIIKTGYLFFIFKDSLEDEKFLRYSVISFPVMTSLFAGVALLVSAMPSLVWLSNICGVGLILSILIGAILRRYSLRTKKVKGT